MTFRFPLRRSAAASVVGVMLLGVAAPASLGASSSSDWPRYLHDLASSGSTAESLITPSNAASLRLAAGWPVKGGGTISTQPIVANDLAYWGSWDGLEHATPVPGSSASGWATNLGQTSAAGCAPPTAGVASTGTVVSVTLAGQTSPRSVLFVGGGGNNSAGGGSVQLYALDALTGAVLWHTALGSSPSRFPWSSPAVYTYTDSSGAQATSVYVGVASFGDCPLVQGQVVQLDAGSGQIQNTFNVVSNGCDGGGVWGSPTIDQADGSLYVSTGNPGSCASAEPYAEALLKLRASDLSLVGYWQIPPSEQTSDGDFGAAATLFSGTVTSSGTQRSLVGVPNKNGTYYVFDRSSVGTGPVARLGIANPGDCPQCGMGSISPSAWDGTTLYVAGGNTTVKGTPYPGSLRAWNPNALNSPLWAVGMPDGPVLGAVAGAPGLVAVGEGSYTEVLASSSGSLLLRLPVSSIGSSSPATFYGAPSVAHGTLFEGDTQGNLYAYTVNSGPGGGTYASVIAGLSPVAYWRLGDTSGTTAADAAGTNTGTYLGAPTLGVPGLLTGDPNTAVHFHGATFDQVTVPSSTSLDQTGSLSIAAWIDADTWGSGNPRILQKGINDNQYRLLVEFGMLKFSIAGVGTASVTPPTAGARHFIVGTYDGSAIRLYVDDVLVATTAATGSIPATSDPLAIGNKPTSTNTLDPFTGIIDEVSIHAIALSASQVGALWSTGNTAGTNHPPTAVASASPTSGTAPLTVAFSGTGSSDPDPGDTLTYSWDLNGDGVFGDSTLVNPSFTYTNPGTYIAALQVTDNHGAVSNTATVTITVHRKHRR